MKAQVEIGREYSKENKHGGTEKGNEPDHSGNAERTRPFFDRSKLRQKSLPTKGLQMAKLFKVLDTK